MPVTCQVSQSRSIKGHNVSKSNRRTKKIFHVNVKPIKFFSAILGQDVILKVTNRGMRTVIKHGGLDCYILNSKPSKISDVLKPVKKRLKGAIIKKGLVGKTPEEIQIQYTASK